MKRDLRNLRMEVWLRNLNLIYVNPGTWKLYAQIDVFLAWSYAFLLFHTGCNLKCFSSGLQKPAVTYLLADPLAHSIPEYSTPTKQASALTSQQILNSITCGASLKLSCAPGILPHSFPAIQFIHQHLFKLYVCVCLYVSVNYFFLKLRT